MRYNPGLAVIDDQAAYLKDQAGQTRRIEHAGFAGLADLLEFAHSHGLNHLWPVAESNLSRRAADKRWYQAREWDCMTIYDDPQERNIAAFTRAWRLDKTGETIFVGWCEWLWWPWSDRESVRQLLATLTYVENLLEMPVEWTPGHMSLETLRRGCAGHWHWLQTLTFPLSDHVNVAEACRQLYWKSPDVPRGRRVMKLDKNSTFLASAPGLNVGAGNPAVVDASFYDGKRPGFWNVYADPGTSYYDGIQWPAVEKRRVMTTDTIVRLRELGWHIEIEKGVAWQEYHRTLADTATYLWNVRQAARKDRDKSPAHENAYLSIGDILHALPGKLGDSDNRQKHFRRPDIWALIEAKAAANLLHTIEKIRRLKGKKPCLVRADAVWYDFDEETPEQGLEGLIEPDKFGGLKVEYVVDSSDYLRYAWASWTPGQATKYLNGLAGRNTEDERMEML